MSIKEIIEYYSKPQWELKIIDERDFKELEADLTAYIEAEKEKVKDRMMQVMKASHELSAIKHHEEMEAEMIKFAEWIHENTVLMQDGKQLLEQYKQKK